MNKNKRARGRIVPPQPKRDGMVSIDAQTSVKRTERHGVDLPSDAPWWGLANMDMMYHLVNSIREELSDIAWQGHVKHGKGFVWLTIDPSTFDAWRFAWQNDEPFEGADIRAQFIPAPDDAFERLGGLENAGYLAPALAFTSQYSSRVDMIISTLLPEEDTQSIRMVWVASEAMSGVDHTVAERCKEVDRAVLNEISGARSYIRFAANGEMKYSRPLLPVDLMHVYRGANNWRSKNLYNAMVCVAGDDVGDIMVSGPIEGFIYLVRRRDEIKIGKTINLHQRLKQLESVFAIEGLVHYILTDDVARAERAIHKWMAPYRMSGEWFRLPPEKEELIRHILCLYMHDTIRPIKNSIGEEEMIAVCRDSASRVSGIPVSNDAILEQAESMIESERFKQLRKVQI
jgi:hypothetical protein